jgi:glycosyltransferase involved in cell wall biosynthesis
VVHLHNLWQYPQFAGYRAARAAGVPYIVSPHGALDPYLRGHGRVRKQLSMSVYQQRLLSEAALIHVTTSAEAELMADVVPDVPRVVVPCGMYVDRFRTLPPPEQFRRGHLHGYGGPLVLFLGRLTYKKGVDVLIRAFAEAQRARESRLVVAGPDDEGLTPGLARLAQELGVEDRVVFTGPLYGEDRLAALSSADVWALSSHTENFGIAVIEAMAAGCAVCVSPAVNVSGDIAAAGAGIVADPTPAAFGEEIDGLLADESRRRELEAKAPGFAERYDWNRVAPALVAMYQRAASMA